MMRLHLSPMGLALSLNISVGLFVLGCEKDAGLLDVRSAREPEAFNGTTDPLELIRYLNNQPQVTADSLVPSADIDQLISVPADAKPFSGTYWPMDHDGILAKWQGTDTSSPAEKYGELFLASDEQQKMYTWIHKNQGKGVPHVKSWFGICQGWAASSIIEKAPQHQITVRKIVNNGVVSVEPCASGSTTDCVSFTPGDLTALLAAVYADSEGLFIGERCDTRLSRFKYDSSKRVLMPNCRSNAGTLFLLATNFIKQSQHTFVLNSGNNDQIWNQPVFAYKISKYQKVSVQKATQLVDAQETSYGWNSLAADFRYVVMTLYWAEEAQPTVSTPPPLDSTDNTYRFILELDGSGAVLGGEWIGGSKTDHPPFYWFPTAPGTRTPGLVYEHVKALLDASRM